ncbi:MAG: adenylosuccinate synthetase, partial [Flavisolibacter sp.]|nr:adenylosuccinate synthetase [Flavisolibacter sp.]
SKAYCTRVGSGPFPTELHDETGEELRKLGSEFGATTGRPRRCGWIDLIALKFACMINGVTSIIMTKADVLDSFKTLQVCTAYKIDEKEITEVPFQMDKLKIDTVYKNFKGWEKDISAVKDKDDLPGEMKEYVQFIEKFLNTPVQYISNGPGRDQIIKN